MMQVGYGELLDRQCVLELQWRDSRRGAVARELSAVDAALQFAPVHLADAQVDELRAVNAQLWSAKRDGGRQADIPALEQQRAACKAAIDARLGYA